MQRSTERILTAHVGSLPRPRDLVELDSAKHAGQDYDESARAARLRTGVAEVVRLQVEVASRAAAIAATRRGRLPEGKILIPGVVSHATNVIEHPEVVADRITRYAEGEGEGERDRLH